MSAPDCYCGFVIIDLRKGFSVIAVSVRSGMWYDDNAVDPIPIRLAEPIANDGLV